MPNPDFFFLSLASVSAVLLGICVTLRNNAFSTVLRHYDERIQLGDKDYEPILNRSAHSAMVAGFFFFGAIISSFIGLFNGPSQQFGVLEFWSSMITFSIGLTALLYALFTGHIRRPSLRSPGKPDRSDRPEVETGDDPD